MKLPRLLLTTLVLLSVSTVLKAAEDFVTFSAPPAGSLCLTGTQKEIVFDSNDYKGVLIAIDNLKNDLKAVTGSDRAPLIIGTVGKSEAVKEFKDLAKQLKGKNEQYFITKVQKDGQDALLILGSDKRGTIYGIYELSRQIGVSPWYWWADVPAQKHSSIYFKDGLYTDGEPAVKYRGIFINDEWPAMGNWTSKKFGGFNHKLYEKVFELVLRLKGNYMWPAMWSAAFYADDPENLKTADDMGIIMGTSHHEPCAKAHQEWTRVKTRGAWNYDTNREELVNFWREGIERMKDTEDVVTIGMRGNGDEPMGDHADVSLLERIVDHQRKLIAKATGKPANKTPQVWALYKEVQEYYEKGMRVPDDVILLLCDDNWGNVRILPNYSKEKNAVGIKPHKGGYGMYYHVDYVGGPRCYRWLNVSQIQRIWEQMKLTYEYGVDKLWILNVGDLKPMEFPIDFWFKMAWNPQQFNENNLYSYTEDFCKQQFTDKFAKEAARILNLEGKYAARVTPEMLSPRTYSLETGEWDHVLSDYKTLEADALGQYLMLPKELKDAYYQLVLFPVRAMANMYELNYCYAKNAALAANNNIAANQWAERARMCYDKDSVLMYEYNHILADGKWNHMMDQLHIGYTNWNEPRQRYFPEPKYVAADAAKPSTPLNIFSDVHGVVSIEAHHYASAENAKDAKWTIVPDFGRTEAGVALMPYNVPTDGASITYKFKTTKTGAAKIYFYFAPTFPFNGTQLLSCSVDGGDKQSFEVNPNKGDQNGEWEGDHINKRSLAITIPSSSDGIHTLTLYPHHPGTLLEKLEIDLGGRKPTYLGMPESPRVK